jgi:hypothetical protein
VPIHIFNTLDQPGIFTSDTQAWDINDTGQIVGQYSDLGGTHGFLFDARCGVSDAPRRELHRQRRHAGEEFRARVGRRELRLANGVVLLAKFDGEFASHSTTYAGTGTVRYTW